MSGNKKFFTHVSLIALLSAVGMVEAKAAALNIGGATDADVTTAADTWDIDDSVGGNAATLTFGTNLDSNTQLTVTSGAGGNDTAVVNTVTVADDGNGNDSNTLIVGNGIHPVTLNIKGNVSGDFGTNSADLRVRISAADGNGGTAGDATVNFEGASIALGTGSITLDDEAGATATVGFTSGVAQEVTGVITAATAGEGVLSITNTDADGVTFDDAVGVVKIGSITIGDVVAHKGSVATFNSAVAASQIRIGTDGVPDEGDGAEITSSTVNFNDSTTATNGFVFGDTEVGGGAADTNTARFTSGDHDYTVTGAFTAADDFDSNWIFVDATDIYTITFANAISGVERISIGENGEDAVTVQFQDNITATQIFLGGADNQDATARFASTSTMTVSGTIDKQAGDPNSNLVIYSRDNDISHTVTFENTIGNMTEIRIGDATLHTGGEGIFNDTVTTGTLTITAANTDDASASVGRFNSELTATSGVSIVAGNSALEDASAYFSGNVSGTTMILNSDELHHATATIYVDGDDAQAIDGTINGAASHEGNIVITDSTDNQAPDADTFSGAIGGVFAINDITVGSTDDAGSAIFSNSVSAKTVHVIGGDHVDEDSTVELDRNITATAITLDDTNTGGTATLTLGGTGEQTISGTIDGASAGEGAIIIANGAADTAPATDTFLDSIGATGALASIAVGTSTAAGKAVFSSPVSAHTITVTSGNHANEDSSASFLGDVTAAIVLDDTSVSATTAVTFDGTSDQILTGSINAKTAGEGSVLFNNTTTVTGNVGETLLGSLVVVANNTLTMGAKGSTAAFGAQALSINGAVQPLDTLTLTAGTNLRFNDGSTIVLSDISVIPKGEAFFDASAHQAAITIGTRSSDTTTVTVPTTFINGSVGLFDARDGATYTQNGHFSIAPSALFEYNVVNKDGLVSIVASARPATILKKTLGISDDEAAGLAAGVAAAADDVVVTNAYNTALGAGGAEAKKAAQQSLNSPTTLSAVGTVGGNTVAAAADTIITHIASLRGSQAVFAQNENQTGMASGGRYAEAGKVIWAKPFYTSISGKEGNRVAGYDASTTGIVMGADLYQTDQTTFGVAFSYAQSAIDGNGAGHDSADVSNYQLTAYGSYHMPAWYVDVLAGYGINDSEAQRHINFGGLNRIASAEYSGDQYVLKADGGMPIQIAEDSFITPLIGFHYANIANDAYHETGAGVLNLSVDTTDMDLFQTLLGVRLHRVVHADSGYYIPHLSLGVSYEFLGNEIQSTSSYAEGSSPFIVTGNNAEQVGKNIGTGLTYQLDRFSLSVEYQADFHLNYISQTGMLGTRFSF